MKKYWKYYLLFALPLTFSIGKILLGNVVALISSVLWLWVLFSLNNSHLKTNRFRSTIIFMFVFVVFSFFFTAEKDDYIEAFVDQNYVLPYFAILLGSYKFPIQSLNISNRILLIGSICFLLIFYFKMTFIFGMDGMTAKYILREDSMPFDNVTKRLCLGVGLLLLLGPYLKRKVFLIALAAILVNLIVAVYLGRRNVILTSVLFLIVCGYRFIKYQEMNKVLKYTLLLFTLVGTTFIIADFLATIKDNQFFELLYSRWDKDTRSSVTNYFYKDMEQSPIQWLIGKGITSTYYCPDVPIDTLYRKTVETGWQHIVLKLGLPFLIIYLGIQLIAIVKCKKNFITSACLSYILIMMIELMFAGVPNFDIRYVTLWLCISLCANKNVGMLDDKEIKKILKE